MSEVEFSRCHSAILASTDPRLCFTCEASMDRFWGILNKCWKIILKNKNPKIIFINLNSDWKRLEEKQGSIDKNMVKLISHETLHLVLSKIEGNETSNKLDNIFGKIYRIKYYGLGEIK